MAYFISLLLHPLLMPSYLFIFIIFFASSFMQPLRIESLFQIVFVIFLVTFVVPVISLGILRLTNYIPDFQLENRSQRIVPFFFIACFYGLTAYLFHARLSVNNLVVIIFASTTLLILLIMAITFWWKISVHGAAIGGVMGIVVALNMFHPIENMKFVLAVLMVLVGVVNYSRLKLQAHTPSQVYLGTLLGFFTCFFSVYYFL